MKTQVIQLDVHDNLISIRDRMGWVKTPRILLVWPKRGQMEVRPLDLTLLRRHAEDLGAELGLVTRSGEIRAAARELHISVFSSTSDAQKKPWLEASPARPRRRFPSADLRAWRGSLPAGELFNLSVTPLRRVLIFAAGVLAVLLVVLVFIPSAEIQLALPEQKQSLALTVSADPQVKSIQVSGVVPVRNLTLAVEGTDSALASGSLSQPGQTASGTVVLKNLGAKPVTVPAGSLLVRQSTPPVSFATLEKVELPAGKGSTTSVTVRASQAGAGGNLPPGPLVPEDTVLAANLTASNPQPISGGTQTLLPLATSQDRDSLKKRLLLDLQRQALDGFSRQSSPADVLLPASLNQVSIVSERFDPPEGEPGDKLSLRLRVEYSLGYAAGSDLRTLAEWVLNASLPVGYAPAGGSVTLEPASGFTSGGEVIRWQMRAARTMRPLLDSVQVIGLVQGKTAARAGQLMQQTYGLAQPAKISIRPAWWPWLPFLPFRIAVKG